MAYTLADFWIVFGALCGFWCVYGTLITAWHSMMTHKAAWAQIQLLGALILFPLAIVALCLVFLIGRLHMYCTGRLASVSMTSDDVSVA
ncbi:unnamed protein product [Rotaria socialis]|uniref:Uncharacterized protein n=1 Tax=Rotaria socialis TaxID=392032 RepID=A0A817ZL17_9BILA|nr:unnamed protein product [Rotaria socialis]CAF4431044.1 unnamed protein product [Rotaria socialis]